MLTLVNVHSFKSQIRKFGFGSVCNEEPLKLCKRGSL